MKNKVNNIQLKYGNTTFKVFLLKVEKNPRALDSYHLHHFYELHFCIKGSYTYKIENKEILLKPNELLIIPPSTNHNAINPFAEDYDYEHVVLQFSISQSEEPYNFYDYFKATLNDFSQKPISLPDFVIAQVVELYNLGLPNNLKNYCYIKSKICTLLFDLFDNLNGFTQHADSLFSTRDYEEILVLLNTLVNQHDLTLRAIASELNYSERHTARLIKRMYNMTLSEIYENKAAMLDDVMKNDLNEEDSNE